MGDRRRHRGYQGGARWNRSRYLYRPVDEDGSVGKSYYCDLILEARTDQEDRGWPRIRVYLNQRWGPKPYADYVLVDGKYSKKVS